MTEVGLTPSYCFLQSDSAQSDYMNPVKQTNLGKSLQHHTLAWDKRWKALCDKPGTVSAGWSRTCGRINKTYPQEESMKVNVAAQAKVSVSSDFNQVQKKDGKGSKSDHSRSQTGQIHGAFCSEELINVIKTGCSKKKMIETAKDVKMEKEEPMK